MKGPTWEGDRGVGKFVVAALLCGIIFAGSEGRRIAFSTRKGEWKRKVRTPQDAAPRNPAQAGVHVGSTFKGVLTESATENIPPGCERKLEVR